MNTRSEPCVLVIFGASGDLAARKLIPSLYEMHRDGLLPDSLEVLGVARSVKSEEDWRKELEPWLEQHDPKYDPKIWKSLRERIHYEAADATTPEGMKAVGSRIAGLDAAGRIGGNILFFLSVASSLYEPIVEQIGREASLVSGYDRPVTQSRRPLLG